MSENTSSAVSEADQLTTQLRKKSTEAKSNDDVLSRLISEHESRKSALEDERKRLAVDSCKLLDQAADMIVELMAEIKRQGEEIVALTDQNRELLEKNGKLCAHQSSGQGQPGPPLGAKESTMSIGNSTALKDTISVESQGEAKRPLDNEARKSQEAEDEVHARIEAQTQQDLELAMAVQQQEIDASKGHGDRQHQHLWGRDPEDSGSESETDSDDEESTTAQPAKSQGVSQKLYSFVAGIPATPMTKEEKLTKEVRRLKKQCKRVTAAYQDTYFLLNQKTKEAQRYHDQGYKYYMENGSLHRRCKMLDQERKAMTTELGDTKQQLSDAINLSEVRGKKLKAVLGMLEGHDDE